MSWKDLEKKIWYRIFVYMLYLLPCVRNSIEHILL